MRKNYTGQLRPWRKSLQKWKRGSLRRSEDGGTRGDGNWPMRVGLALWACRKETGTEGSQFRRAGRDQRNAGVLRLMDGLVIPQKRHFAFSALLDLKT